MRYIKLFEMWYLPKPFKGLKRLLCIKVGETFEENFTVGEMYDITTIKTKGGEDDYCVKDNLGYDHPIIDHHINSERVMVTYGQGELSDNIVNDRGERVSILVRPDRKDVIYDTTPRRDFRSVFTQDQSLEEYKKRMVQQQFDL